MPVLPQRGLGALDRLGRELPAGVQPEGVRNHEKNAVLGGVAGGGQLLRSRAEVLVDGDRGRDGRRLGRPGRGLGGRFRAGGRFEPWGADGGGRGRPAVPVHVRLADLGGLGDLGRRTRGLFQDGPGCRGGLGRPDGLGRSLGFAGKNLHQFVLCHGRPAGDPAVAGQVGQFFTGAVAKRAGAAHGQPPSSKPSADRQERYQTSVLAEKSCRFPSRRGAHEDHNRAILWLLSRLCVTTRRFLLQNPLISLRKRLASGEQELTSR